MEREMSKEKRCGNCARHIRNPEKPGCGWCDEWGGVELSDDVVCHPYLWIPKKDKAEEVAK